MPIEYAELHCISNFSFLRGASHPQELVARAHALGYRALALTDECSVSGVVRAHEQARELGMQLIIGSELQLQDGPRLVLLATDRTDYAALCQLITRARRRAPKGTYILHQEDLESGLAGCLALLIPPPGMDLPDAQLAWFAHTFQGRGWLAVELLRDGLDQARLQQLNDWSEAFDLPLVASGDVYMHVRSRRVMQDLLTAIRLNKPVSELGLQLQANGERHLRQLDELASLYPAELLAETARIAGRCDFSLDEISYQYPDDVTPAGMQAQAFLRQLTEEGIKNRWPAGCGSKVRQQIEHELQLIDELAYAAYFLTVWDIVRFARSQQILCQGRGSAANSAVCYCLGITEVDPARMNMLFERFISRERDEPPDIDVDFEHERREEVIQYIYHKYGRQRAALTASLITYRPKSALRDTAKALGLSREQVEQLAAAVSGWRRHGVIEPDWLREAGFDPDNPRMHQLLVLANGLLGFPRHLSQHVGGFVIARDRLDELVPIENAAMRSRSIIQWDKDDLETLGLLKIDILALGMLSAIRKTFDLVNAMPALVEHAGIKGVLGMQNIPVEDPLVYQMIQQADTIGVFQIESRAQMSMLPRLRPACFYDLVIEVAIVRPGPIQGDMVHPYLRRRQGLEALSYPSEAVRDVLERTLGVPIFQEQVIKLAMVAAGFSPGDADQLRRSMAAWKRRGDMALYQQKLMQGMCERGYEKEFAERILRQIQGFGEYGFPESHAASFALLVYVSAWLKCHVPAAFTAALINSLPMGFYAPAQLVRDAREHHVQVLPVDVNTSHWDCTLESRGQQFALRLGMRLVKGMSRRVAGNIVNCRELGQFRQVDELAHRARLNRADLKALAAADALGSLSEHRHQAYWDVAGVEAQLPILPDASFHETRPDLLPPTEVQDVVADYAQLGLSLRCHPLSLLRDELRRLHVLSAEEISRRTAGETVHLAGLVMIRQRPGKGNAVFITLEDETGILNLIVWRQLAEQQRRILLGAHLLGAWAEIQRADGVQHLIVKRLEDHTDLLTRLQVKTRDFH